MSDSFETMLAEAAENVRKRKHLVRDLGVNGRDAGKVVRTRTPGSVTDKTFMAGIGTIGDQIKDEFVLAEMNKEYQRHTGKSLPLNAVHVPSLVPVGAKMGHPDAIVDSNNARSQIKQNAAKQNVPLRGRITQDAVETPPEPEKPIADRITKRMVKTLKRTEPELAKKSDRELREIVTDRHTCKTGTVAAF